ncbi:MAG: hypothetical protein WA790_02470 [Sulfitobacter sp.]
MESIDHYYPPTIPEKKINHNSYFEELALPATARGPDRIAELLNRLHPERVNIISAESLQNVDPFHVAKIFEHCEVQVVCYLRHEFDMLVSGHAQSVKASGAVQSIDSYIEARYRNLDYNAFLTSWAKAFDDRLRVVVYHPAKFHNESIVSDFMHRFVSDPPSDVLTTQNQWRNPSLTRTTLPYVLHINRNPDQFPLPAYLTARERVVGFGKLSQKYPGRLRLPLRWRERLGPQFQASQQTWARRYLDHPAPFEYAAYPASTTDPALEEHTIHALHQEFLEVLQSMRGTQEMT